MPWWGWALIVAGGLLIVFLGMLAWAADGAPMMEDGRHVSGPSTREIRRARRAWRRQQRRGPT